MNRRNFLAKTGVGAGVAAAGGAGLGGVTATNADPAEDPSVVTTVDATGTHGFITRDSDTPGGAQTMSLLDIEDRPFTVEGNIEITGKVYDDGTWKITSASFPTYSATEYDVSVNLVATDYSTPGTFDPESGTVTASVTLSVESDTKTFNQWPIDLTFTSGTSGDMTGTVNRETESVLDVTLVNNEYPSSAVVPLESATHSQNASPSLVERPLGWGPSGTNWFELGLEMTVDDPGGLDEIEVEPQAVVGSNSPQDLDGDGHFEDIRGDGEFDVSDVQTLFDNLDNPTVQNHSANYNFSGGSPREVTVFDVQSLFSKLGD